MSMATLIDEDTARLLTDVMQTLAGVLGLIMGVKGNGGKAH